MSDGAKTLREDVIACLRRIHEVYEAGDIMLPEGSNSKITELLARLEAGDSLDTWPPNPDQGELKFLPVPDDERPQHTETSVTPIFARTRDMHLGSEEGGVASGYTAVPTTPIGPGR